MNRELEGDCAMDDFDVLLAGKRVAAGLPACVPAFGEVTEAGTGWALHLHPARAELAARRRAELFADVAADRAALTDDRFDWIADLADYAEWCEMEEAAEQVDAVERAGASGYSIEDDADLWVTP